MDFRKAFLRIKYYMCVKRKHYFDCVSVRDQGPSSICENAPSR